MENGGQDQGTKDPARADRQRGAFSRTWGLDGPLQWECSAAEAKPVSTRGRCWPLGGSRALGPACRVLALSTVVGVPEWSECDSLCEVSRAAVGSSR